MYKGKLEEGDLEGFTQEQYAAMKAICAKRKAEIEHLYSISRVICK